MIRTDFYSAFHSWAQNVGQAATDAALGARESSTSARSGTSASSHQSKYPHRGVDSFLKALNAHAGQHPMLYNGARQIYKQFGLDFCLPSKKWKERTKRYETRFHSGLRAFNAWTTRMNGGDFLPRRPSRRKATPSPWPYTRPTKRAREAEAMRPSQRPTGDYIPSKRRRQAAPAVPPQPAQSAPQHPARLGKRRRTDMHTSETPGSAPARKKQRTSAAPPRLPTRPAGTQATFSSKVDAQILRVREVMTSAVVMWMSTLDDKDALPPDQLREGMANYRRLMDQNLDYSFAKLAAGLNDANDRSGDLRRQLATSKERARSDIAQEMRGIVRAQGWMPYQSRESNVQWEPGRGPLLVKRGLSMEQVQLAQADIASGAFGSVSRFRTDNGGTLIGKISKNAFGDGRGGIRDDLTIELQAYQKIYATAGTHPNLVQAYGIGKVPYKDGTTARALLMDAVPGPNGNALFTTLHQCWKSGKISHEEYWGAIQYIGTRMLDVTRHLAKAGIVHNDIKPDNFMVNEETGEPIVIDLGLWTNQGQAHSGGSMRFMSPEAQRGKAVGHRGDVFTVGATLAHGVERTVAQKLPKPNEGLQLRNDVQHDENRNVVRPLGVHHATTAYTAFITRVMAPDKEQRPTAERAQALDFLNDRLLDDAAAREAIKKAIAIGKNEDSKPQLERWQMPARPVRAVAPRNNEVDAEFPDLAAYAQLYREGKLDSRLREQIEPSHLSLLRNDPEFDEMWHLREEARADAAVWGHLLLVEATWFNEVRQIERMVPPERVVSGVDMNGVRLPQESTQEPTQHRQQRAALADWMRERLRRNNISITELQRHVDSAEAFLHDVRSFDENNDPVLASSIELVRERAIAARRLVDLDKEYPAGAASPKPLDMRMLRATLQRKLDHGDKA